MTQSRATTRRLHLKLLASAAAGAVCTGAGLDAFAGGVAAARAGGAGEDEDYDFVLARVKFECESRGRGARWNVYPGGDRYLLEEFAAVARSKIKLPRGCAGTRPEHGTDAHFGAVVTFDDPAGLQNHPFAFMTGEGHFSFSARRRENLKQYIEEGGFLLIDDCVWAPDGDFLFQSACKMLEETFGNGAVRPVPHEHEIFRNIYDLSDTGLPHCQGKNHGAKGVFIQERLAVFVSSTDIHCGWADRDHVFFPPGTTGYREAIQMGINILMYAMSH